MSGKTQWNCGFVMTDSIASEAGRRVATPSDSVCHREFLCQRGFALCPQSSMVVWYADLCLLAQIHDLHCQACLYCTSISPRHLQTHASQADCTQPCASASCGYPLPMPLHHRRYRRRKESGLRCTDPRSFNGFQMRCIACTDV